MEYSFYSKETNLPLVPKNIIIKYDDYVDNFFENYFRYFNSNNKDNFVSRYIFEPKMIKEIMAGMLFTQLALIIRRIKPRIESPAPTV